MATLDSTAQLTIAEMLKRKDPNGNPAKIAMILTKVNEILKDAPWLEANDTFSNTTTRQLYIPPGTARKINGGVAISSSLTTQINDVIAIFADYSQTDCALIDTAPDPAAARVYEAKAKIEGMSQTLATKIIYGNSHTTPEEFTGLAPRLNSTGLGNVKDAGGSGGDTTSLYIVQFGEDRAHMIYPKNSPNYGVTHKDLGEQTADVSTTAGTHSFLQVYRDYFEVKAGMVVRDNQCIARVANIEVSGTSNIFDPDDLIELIDEALYMNGEGAVIYAPPKLFSQMDKLAMDKSNVLYGVTDVFGVPTTAFRGIPIRKVQAIVYTETAVSA